MRIQLKKQIIQSCLLVSSGILLQFPVFADVNPYTMFGSGDTTDQNQSSQSQEDTTSTPTTTMTTTTTAPATSSTVVANPSPSYQMPAPLVQPGSNQASSAAPVARPALKLSSAVTSSNPPASFTPGLLSNATVPPTAGSSQSGAGNSNQDDILPQINSNIEMGNKDLMARFALEDSLDYPGTPSFSPTFIQEDSGYDTLASYLNTPSALPTFTNPLTQSGSVANTLNQLYSTTAFPSAQGNQKGGAAQLATNEMSLLNQTVLRPFSQQWSSDLVDASSPQLLRTIAVQQAVQNYILFLQLQNMNAQVAQQASNGVEMQALLSQVTIMNNTNQYYLKLILKKISANSNINNK